LSYYGLTNAGLRASKKDLPVKQAKIYGKYVW
jgi:hypothetical protein